MCVGIFLECFWGCVLGCFGVFFGDRNAGAEDGRSIIDFAPKY